MIGSICGVYQKSFLILQFCSRITRGYFFHFVWERVLRVQIQKKSPEKNMLNSNEFWGIFMQYLLQGDSYPARQLSNDPCTENVFRVDMIEASHFPCTLFL